MDYTDLRCRPLLHVRARLLGAVRDFLNGQDWIEVDAPMITSLTGACEDASTVFGLDYYGRRACLRQTAQLHLEPLVGLEGRVYTIGPSFRYEPRAAGLGPDGRHLSEFTLVEAEGEGLDLNDLIQLEEGLVRHLLDQRSGLERDLAALAPSTTPTLCQATAFPRVTYTEAIVLLRRSGRSIEWGNDLAAQDELALLDLIPGPLFLTNHPTRIKFFNMKRNAADGEVVDSVDLLLPGVGEAAGGSVREERESEIRTRLNSSRLARQIAEAGYDIGEFEWYLTAPHLPRAGFGLGFERFLRWYCGLATIADTCVYPRVPGALEN